MRAAQRTQRETMTDDKTTEPSASSTEPSSTEPSAEDIDSRFSRITFPIEPTEHDHGLSPE